MMPYDFESRTLAERFDRLLHIFSSERFLTMQGLGNEVPFFICPYHPQEHEEMVKAIGNLEIQPYPVPHDAREPVQYRFADGQHRLGVLTDTGIITAHIIDTLNSCDALVLECNHDRELLTRSRYPQTLKQRIGGRYGHLANEQAAELLHQIDTSRLQHLVAAHLSQENNRPELAAKALASAVGCSAEWIGVADQDSGLDWRQIG